eukprot:5303863-Ditylum_brightwellii.AAC.1
MQKDLENNYNQNVKESPDIITNYQSDNIIVMKEEIKHYCPEKQKGKEISVPFLNLLQNTVSRKGGDIFAT